MKVSNKFGIEIEIDKEPTLLTGADGSHRGEDSIIIRIDDVRGYDTDLLINGEDLVIHLSNEDALNLIQKLAICIGKNVDKEFEKAFPGIPPF